jgi:hypothetical protein
MKMRYSNLSAAALLFSAALLQPNNVQVVVAELTTMTISSLSNLPYDENGHLATHILAYPASGPCNALVEAAITEVWEIQHVPVAVDGEAAKILFGDKLPSPTNNEITNVEQCPAVCLERGVDSYLVGYPLPEKYYNPTENDDHNSFQNFIGSPSCGNELHQLFSQGLGFILGSSRWHKAL